MDLGRNKVKGLLVGYRDVLYLKMHKYLTPELDTFTLKKTCSIKLFYFTFTCNISNINYCLNFVSMEYVILCQIHKSQRDNSTFFYKIPTIFVSEYFANVRRPNSCRGHQKKSYIFAAKIWFSIWSHQHRIFFNFSKYTAAFQKLNLYARHIFFEILKLIKILKHISFL